MQFVNAGDNLYCMNGTDQYTKLNGTTLTQPAAVPSSFAPSFGVIFNSTMWTAGWATNSNQVYRSVPNNFDDFTGTGSGQMGFGEQVTGLATNNESLFFFSKNSVAVTTKGDITTSGTTFGYAVRQIQSEEGAINNASIVASGNMLFYLTPTNKIMSIGKGQSNLGFDTLDLSHRKYRGIDNLMASLDPDQSESFGYFVPGDNLVKWHLRSYGATFNDTCIIYSVQYDEFLVDTQKFLYAGCSYKDKEFTVSNIEAKVFQDEYGQTDDDTPIQFEYQTKSFAPS